MVYWDWKNSKVTNLGSDFYNPLEHPEHYDPDEE